MPTLLVIDDEPNIVYSFKSTLASAELNVISASTARDGIELIKTRRPDVVMLDVRLPDLSGLQAYERIRAIDERMPVIVMTAFAKTETAIEAMRLGAFEYLVKPVDLRRLKDVVSKALEVSRLNRVPALLKTEETDNLAADHIVGNSPAMQDVYKGIGRIAPQDSTVLIVGESGTGKELVARAIYHYSQRNQKPFLAINCAALPESLLESELFGHERGAFTGADQRRIGKFEQVNGGTIFLDEIGDMSPATQAKALRLLQEQQFERIGGNITVKTDVRIITATNRDLSQLVAEGKFRQDLLYRLNGFTIQLPPLRERREDIPILTDHFLKLFNRDLNKSVVGVSADVMHILQSHDWPGNVREFQSAIKYAIIQATGAAITRDCLPQSCSVSQTSDCTRQDVGLFTNGTDETHFNGSSKFDLIGFVRQLLTEDRPDLYRVITQEIDHQILREVMAYCHGSQLQAAEKLGISRMTLRSKLRAHGIIQEKGNGTSDR
jgi:DNA-binding NtrC family response regulator